MTSQPDIYQKIQSAYNFSDMEIKQMKFTLSLLTYEWSKLLILAVVFFVLGYFPEYACAVAVLLPIRIFSGGLHFNHYYSCFIFTTLFFVVPIFVLDTIVIAAPIQAFLILACLLVTFFIGPVTSKKRPLLTKKRYTTYRLISSGLILIYVFIFAFAGIFPFRNLCFWIILLQSLQLICAKLVRKGDIHEKD